MIKRNKLRFFSLLLLLVFILGQSSVFATDLPKRSEVSDAYKWDLTDLYADRAAFEKDVALLTDTYIPKLAAFKGTLNTAENIRNFLQLDTETSIILTNVYMYPNLSADLNQGDSNATEMVGIAMNVYGAYLSATSYATPEILLLDEATLLKFAEEKDMTTYKHFLDSLLKQKAHILSADEEKIMALTSDITTAPSEIYNKATIADYKYPEIVNAEGETITLTSSAYYKILETADRETRKKAFEARSNSFMALNNTISATMNAEVKKNIFGATVRGYDSALDASLAAEYIPRSIYENLVSSVNKNLEPLHKYYTVRKKAMGLEELHSYDTSIPLARNYTFNISFDDANALILKALAPLGEDYLAEYSKALTNNWMDVYEDENKSGGGYNWGNYSTHPYILLNYDNSLDSMSTVAHEMGHALNSVLSNRKQDYFNAGYPIFTAEVASTVNELLLMDYMIKNAKSEDEKLYLLNKQIDNIKGTVYTQVMFAEFEQTIHEHVESGQALSPDYLNNLWLEIIKKYYGPDYTVDEITKANWGRISHFYRNFYVYKYATSISAANEIVTNILAKKEGSVEKYLDFLASGGSDYPVETLLKAGVDMNSSAPVDNLILYFAELVDEFETLLDAKK